MYEKNLEGNPYLAPIQPQDMSAESRFQAAVHAYTVQYFDSRGDQAPDDLYEHILTLLEAPLLNEVMLQARGNQCRATRWLGLARGTVIKKLKKYNLVGARFPE